MSTPNIKLIVIHCAASKNGRPLKNDRESAAQVIDRWHRDRGFQRTAVALAQQNRHLKHIGYHYVIDTDGTVETGRAIGEVGAHVAGHNTGSIGICMVGTDAFTPVQWEKLTVLVGSLRAAYPDAKICGHRDLSPDLNGDGIIQPNEWIKTCPGFTVADWLDADGVPPEGHVWRG
jgi:N-acetyl-anhydromuramyl-L-alanine amidase AmpD